MKRVLTIVIFAIMAIFGAWLLISYIDVIMHNLSEEGVKELANHGWNLFNLILNR